MIKFQDIIDFYVNAVRNLEEGTINLCSPLEEIVIKSAGRDLAYIDNRKDALEKYGFDFWKDSVPAEAENAIEEKFLYSKSNLFPDFMFKVRKVNEDFTCGSLLELKDSKSGSMASFNSTIPTKFKSLEEIDVVNGKNLVSRIASVVDGVPPEGKYYTFDRHCFYLVRTHKCKGDKVKVSVVDGSFFETVPKEHLFHQLFLQILHAHIEKKRIKIPEETLKKVEETLSHITDQTIIAASRVIEGASVRPRLRVMAEVHNEGNPHSSHYPIQPKSFNLILQENPQTQKLKEDLLNKIPKLQAYTIQHKRNGPHIVFSFLHSR